MATFATSAGRGAATDALLTFATPDVYATNALRFTQVNAGASIGEIQRRQQVVTTAMSVGAAVPPGRAQLLPVSFSADEFSKAIQHLQDPPRLLCETLFWFWPSTSPRESHIREALAHNDTELALALLEADVSQHPDDFACLHNLTILLHHLALSWERDQFSVFPINSSAYEGDTLWSKAYSHWKRALESEAFFRYLAQLVNHIDDPRLSLQDAEQVCTLLPEALLQINALLAARYASANHLDGMRREQAVRRQRGYMRLGGFAESTQDLALRRAMQPNYDELQALCQSHRQEATRNPSSGNQILQDLIGKSQVQLAFFDALFSPKHVMSMNAHDNVAEAAYDCAIQYGNATMQWRGVVELIKPLVNLAVSPDIRHDLQRNFEQVVALLASTDFEADLERMVFARDSALDVIRLKPDKGVLAFTRFLRQMHPVVKRFEQELAPFASILDKLFDQMIEVGITCIIAYGNSTQRWNRVNAPLRRLAMLPSSSVMKQRLAELQQTIRQLHARNRCVFCQRRTGDSATELHVPVSRVLQASVSHARLQRNTLTLPRCSRCARRQSHPYLIPLLRAFLIATSCSVIASFTIGMHVSVFFYVIATLIGGILLCLSMLLLRDVLTGSRPLTPAVVNALPAVRALHAQGWQLDIARFS